jgi:hypothetical protein
MRAHVHVDVEFFAIFKEVEVETCGEVVDVEWGS